MLIVDIPGVGILRLEHLVLDLNGTLTDRGRLIEGVADRIDRLRTDLDLHLLTADTFGTATELARRLGIELATISDGEEKARVVARLGPDATVAIGNGRNDVPMLQVAAVGIAVLGPEGAAAPALAAADLVCRSITDALDLLLDPTALVATMRP